MLAIKLPQKKNCIDPASCVEDVEGRIRLDPQDSGRINSGKTYRLLQVCLFGQWSYVCKEGFDAVDRSVALHQLEHTGGREFCMVSGLSWCKKNLWIDHRFRNKGSSRPTFITNIACTGVERRLMDCPISSSLNNRTNCGSGNNNKIVEISVNNHGNQSNDSNN